MGVHSADRECSFISVHTDLTTPLHLRLTPNPCLLPSPAPPTLKRLAPFSPQLCLPVLPCSSSATKAGWLVKDQMDGCVSLTILFPSLLVSLRAQETEAEAAAAPLSAPPVPRTRKRADPAAASNDATAAGALDTATASTTHPTVSQTAKRRCMIHKQRQPDR